MSAPAPVERRRSSRLPPLPAISMQHLARARYETLDSDGIALFGSRGPQPEDVYQGAIGDCWLLSSMASLAYARPQYIRDIFRSTQVPGVWEVRLFVPTDKGVQPRWFRVDARLPLEDGQCVYAEPTWDRTRRKHVVWPALIEKAIARVLRDYRVGYEALDGDVPDTAFLLMTGAETYSVGTQALSQDEFERVLRAAPRSCVVVGTNPMGAAPLHPGHGYTVWGVGPRKRVQLRDPHGVLVSVPLPKLKERSDAIWFADLDPEDVAR